MSNNTSAVPSGPTQPTQTAADQAMQERNEKLAAQFIDCSKYKSQNLAEAKNLVFRLVSVDGEKFLGYPEDGPRNDRICVEIVNGKVIKAIVQ